MKREEKTIEAMVKIYCSHHHGTDTKPCPSCAEFQAYALLRLAGCPFQEGKTTCAKCPVHCYKPDMRQKVREIMRFSGPRMMQRHPFLALMHLLDGQRKTPVRPRKRTAT